MVKEQKKSGNPKPTCSQEGMCVEHCANAICSIVDAVCSMHSENCCAENDCCSAGMGTLLDALDAHVAHLRECCGMAQPDDGGGEDDSDDSDDDEDDSDDDDEDEDS